MHKKKDYRISFDRDKPLFIGGNGGNGDGMLYHSVLSGYLEGFASEVQSGWIKNGAAYRIRATNNSLLNLFKYAYSTRQGNMENSTTLAVADSTGITAKLKGQAAVDWLKKYGYSYELVVPKSLYPKILSIMQRELAMLFPQYTADKVTKNANVLALTAIGNEQPYVATVNETALYKVDAQRAILRGASLDQFIYHLNAIYLQKQGKPIINSTNYHGKVSMELNANMSSIEALNRALEKYALKFVEVTAPTEILTIKDNKPNEK